MHLSHLLEPESTVGLNTISSRSISELQERKRVVIYMSSQLTTLGGVPWKRSEKYGNQDSDSIVLLSLDFISLFYNYNPSIYSFRFSIK